MSVSRHRTAAVFLVLALLVAAPLSLAAPPAEAGVAPPSAASLWSWLLGVVGVPANGLVTASTTEEGSPPGEPSSSLEPQPPLSQSTAGDGPVEDDRSPYIDPDG